MATAPGVITPVASNSKQYHAHTTAGTVHNFHANGAPIVDQTTTAPVNKQPVPPI